MLHFSADKQQSNKIHLPHICLIPSIFCCIMLTGSGNETQWLISGILVNNICIFVLPNVIISISNGFNLC
ncbi:hypothetical protein XELAEV_18021080mg [Xenopus laevis]|uniref:Uncharacterized protein n=1 Tax=Xenopus laevis TaxID=8355 RepID=A0A974HRA0_XENLA|nr:hypothetical protein XELAEV_18021080mg [Xenopus laevis]